MIIMLDALDEISMWRHLLQRQYLQAKSVTIT
jgi:hypothetical protein